MRIRQAKPEDAAAACDLLRRSIVELCVADHDADPAILDAWLRNKTPGTVRSWIEDPRQYVALAVDGGRFCGVGATTTTGEITLNYVSPNARFRGVSTAILSHLEHHLEDLGVPVVRLTSTGTAHRFYRDAGYADDGPARPWRGGKSIYPMTKALSPPFPRRP